MKTKTKEKKIKDFRDDEIIYIENDIKKIQTKTGMYIAFLGEEGALQLAKELIANAIDECINDNSPGRNIMIQYDIATDQLTVEDDGRGIVEDKLELSCTKINSGSKFTRESSGASSGENGLGLTAVNALSSFFEISTFRKKKLYCLNYSEGKKQDSEYWGTDTLKNHGMIVKFVPSKFYLGKNTKIPYEKMIQWVNNLAYFLDPKIKITMVINDGDEVKQTIHLKPKTREDIIKDNVPEMISPIISLTGNTNAVEEFQGRNIDRHINLELIFAYSTDIEPFVDSYCNQINTVDGGAHLDTAKECLWRYLRNVTIKGLTEREQNKLDILSVDVMTGMNLVVNLVTDYNVQFAAQVKNKLTNKEMIRPMKDIANKAISEYFDSHKDDLLHICKIIKMNCKARLEMNKVKSSVLNKESLNVYAEYRMRNFKPANNRGKNQYREIFLIEGDSAKGTVSEARDPATQAVFAFRGVTANAYKTDLSGILSNKEFKDLISVLKCNVGDKFDLSKCWYDRIIIMTDADIDGFGITSLICAFFMKFLPEIVLDGRLCKVDTPLYKVADKDKFVQNKTDYFSRKTKNIAKNYRLKSNIHTELDKDQILDFIVDTNYYLDNIILIAEHFKTNKYLIERIMIMIAMWYKHHELDINNINIEEVNKMLEDDNLTRQFIQAKFPEIVVNGNSFRGVITTYQSINITESFVNKTSSLIQILLKWGTVYDLKYKKDESKRNDGLSLAEALEELKSADLKIVTRYKGLGELNVPDLQVTVMNPNTRRLIELTCDELEKDDEIFKILHSSEPKYMKLRKEMVIAYKIARDDLDN